MKKIVLATANRGKVREIRGILSGEGVEVLSLESFPEMELPPETGSTFGENALIKARHVVKATGMTALADDSGLEVECLGGRPGVWSARYAGAKATDEENYRKLLEELSGVPPEKRGARFVCVMALVEPDGTERLFEGVFEGSIAFTPRGENGFGYDPVFLVPETDKTVAELSSEEKNSMSHRAKALERLKEYMKAKGGI